MVCLYVVKEMLWVTSYYIFLQEKMNYQIYLFYTIMEIIPCEFYNLHSETPEIAGASTRYLLTLYPLVATRLA